MAFVMPVQCTVRLCSVLRHSVWIGFVWQSAVLRFECKRKGNRIIVCFLSSSASPQRVDFAISKYERAGKMPPGNHRYLQLGLE